MWIQEEPRDDDIKCQWDKLVICTPSFPDKYWDKFVKKKVICSSYLLYMLGWTVYTLMKFNDFFKGIDKTIHEYIWCLLLINPGRGQVSTGYKLESN